MENVRYFPCFVGEGLTDPRWMLLLSRFYTNKMTFAPLQSSVPRSDPPSDAEIQWHKSCSPRSMYSLAVSVGILRGFPISGFNKSKSLGSKIFRIGHLRTSSPNSRLQTLHKNYLPHSLQSVCPVKSFRWSCPYPNLSHKPVMDIEIEFLHKNFTEKSPTLLIEYIKRMGSGEAQFFSRTLSLVYGGLVAKVFAPPPPNVPAPVTAAPPQKSEKVELNRPSLWGGKEKEPISSVAQALSALKAATPIDNEEDEFDWANVGKKKKKGPTGSGAQASGQNTPDPDNADDGPAGGGFPGRKGKKKGGRLPSAQPPSTQPAGSNNLSSWFQ